MGQSFPFPFPFPSCARPCLPPFVLSRRPLPFPVLVCSFYFPCRVYCSLCRVWGSMLVHCPRHRHDTRVRSTLRHLHRADLHINVGPHLQ